MTKPILLALLALGPPADDGALAEATAAFEAERWDEAADAFGRAYEADPQPRFLYARGQALRLGGDCQAAIGVYESFIDVSESSEADGYAAEAIEVCTAELQEAATPEPDPPPPVVVEPAPPPSPLVEEPQAPPPAWFRDGLGHGLAWPGVVLCGAGAAMTGLARQRARSADRAPSEAGYRASLDDASVLHVSGITTAAVGATLLVSGVVRFIVVSQRGRRAQATTSVVRF